MKAFIDQLERLAEAFGDPEYLFLVLEPLQYYGIGIGVIGLIATYVLKKEKLQVAALTVMVVSALSILPYLGARQAAQNRIEKVYRIESPARVKGFTSNTEDRLEHRWVYLVIVGIGGAAILVGPRRNRLGQGLRSRRSPSGSMAYTIVSGCTIRIRWPIIPISRPTSRPLPKS